MSMFPPGFILGGGGGASAFADLTGQIANTQIPDAEVGVAKLNATGTADGTTYLRGDGSWATPAGGGSPVSFMYRKNGVTRASTMTKNVIFGTAVTSVGSDITYQNSATNGDSFKINTAGLYIVEVQMRTSAIPASLTIHKNTTQNNPPLDFATETDSVGGDYSSGSIVQHTCAVNCAVNDLIWVALSSNGTVANWNYIKITGPFEVST